MKLFKKTICAVLASVCVLSFSSCERNITGEWRNENNGAIYEFKGAGVVRMRLFNFYTTGTYFISGDDLTLSIGAPEFGVDGNVTYRIESDKIYRPGPDGSYEVYLTRITENSSTGAEGDLPVPGEIDIDEYTYKNSTFGFGFELDRSWDIMWSDDFASKVGNMDYTEALQNLDEIDDFCAINYFDGRRVLVSYDNMKKHMAVAYELESYLNIMKTVFERLAESHGARLKTLEPVSRTLGGKTLDGYYFMTEYEGTNAYEYFFASKFGDYMGTIVINAGSVEELDATLGLFYPLS